MKNLERHLPRKSRWNQRLIRMLGVLPQHAIDDLLEVDVGLERAGLVDRQSLQPLSCVRQHAPSCAG